MNKQNEFRIMWEESLHDLIHTYLSDDAVAQRVGSDQLLPEFRWLRQVSFEPHDMMPMEENQRLRYENNFVVVAPVRDGWLEGKNIDLGIQLTSHEGHDHPTDLCIVDAADWFAEYGSLSIAVTHVTLQLTQSLIIARFGHYCGSCLRKGDFPDAENAYGHPVLMRG